MCSQVRVCAVSVLTARACDSRSFDELYFFDDLILFLIQKFRMPNILKSSSLMRHVAYRYFCNDSIIFPVIDQRSSTD